MSAPFRRAARHRPASVRHREHVRRAREAELARIRTDFHLVRWMRHV
jgi:hypothetical protein